jgi:hypothetical protein
VKIIYDDPNSEEGSASAALLVGEEEFQKGLQLLADTKPWHFRKLLEEDADAITYDVVLQYVALGDIVYG